MFNSELMDKEDIAWRIKRQIHKQELKRWNSYVVTCSHDISIRQTLDKMKEVKE